MGAPRVRWASEHARPSRAKPEPPKPQSMRCSGSLDCASGRTGEPADISAARATLRRGSGYEELRLRTRLVQTKATRIARDQRGQSFRRRGREDARGDPPRAATY